MTVCVTAAGYNYVKVYKERVLWKTRKIFRCNGI